MKRTMFAFLLTILLMLSAYVVHSAASHDISLNEPAPFPKNM